MTRRPPPPRPRDAGSVAPRPNVSLLLTSDFRSRRGGAGRSPRAPEPEVLGHHEPLAARPPRPVYCDTRMSPALSRRRVAASIGALAARLWALGKTPRRMDLGRIRAQCFTRRSSTSRGCWRSRFLSHRHAAEQKHVKRRSPDAIASSGFALSEWSSRIGAHPTQCPLRICRLASMGQTMCRENARHRPPP